jgi:hypothetical protein
VVRGREDECRAHYEPAARSAAPARPPVASSVASER